MSTCVCGSGRDFAACCEPILAGQPAPTAEALMRSRYAAYVVGNPEHLERTCAPEARATFDRADAEQSIAETQWRDLRVVRVVEGGPEDARGEVEFMFRYRQRGQPMAQHELARFRREDGVWLYEGSELNPKGATVRVERHGRNDPCPCGSGKKHKKCCGA